ncbi:hypothetical protein Q8F55_006551 [Vanrija albida]|uniref:Elongation factor 1-gamma n=1 Tax=Vanrija albida TaxID=181172 RepID=A0ABR3PYB6_9TREE
MAPVGTLHVFPGNPRTRRVEAVVALTGLDVTIDSTPNIADGKYKTKEFLAKFPLGYLPAFEGVDGSLLQESAAIADYLAALAPNSNLIPTDPKEFGEVRQWQAFADQEIFIKLGVAGKILRGVYPYSKAIFDGIVKDAVERLQVLDKVLLKKTFLVGERITLADVFVASAVANAFAGLIDAPLRAKIPNVVRYVNTVIRSPKLAKVYEGLEFAEKQPAFVPPTKAEKPKKEEKPKAAKEPKAAPKKKEPEPEEEEPLVAPEVKAKNPLDDLPKSSFNLEEWKRQYSNLDTRGAGGSIEWFYKNYDAEGFSIWKVDFKYNDELTHVFMSANQIGGFFNRLEASRKYLFGSVGVLGKNNDSVITGILILRGKEAIPVVDVAPDYESYDFKLLDLGNAADKEFFEASLAWDLVQDGREWADGKNFK